MKTLYLLMLTTFAVVTLNAQTAYRTRASGNWDNILTWEKWNGAAWILPANISDYPGASDSVYIQVLHTVTLSQHHWCKHLMLNNSTGLRLNLNDYVLSVSGRVALFSGIATFPMSPANVSLGTTLSNGTSNTGRIRFVEESRTVLFASEWSADIAGINFEINLLNNAQQATVEADLRAGRLMVTEGQLLVNGSVFPDNGTLPGDIYVDEGAILTVRNAIRQNIVSSPADSISVSGKLVLGPGSVQTVSCSTIVVNQSGSIEMKNTTAAYAFTYMSYSFAPGADLIYSGDVPGQPAGDEFPTSGVRNLVVNTTGSVELDAAKHVADSMMMISGNILVISNDSLTLGVNNGAVLQHQSGSILGSFNRYVPSGTSGVMLFPTGTSAYHRPVTIDFTSATTTGGSITVTHADGVGGINITPFNDGSYQIDRRSNMYWDVLVNNNIGAGNSTIRANISGQNGVTDSAQLRLIGSTDSGLNLSLLGGTSMPMSGSMSGLSGVNLAPNSYRMYLGGNTITNPLPVKYTSFTGAFERNIIELKWQTASEYNNAFFELQRSKDGLSFTPIATINASGNRNVVSSYSHKDETPFAGPNYYRIAQFDYNQTVHYSTVIKVNASNDPGDKLVWIGPNPVSDELKISLDHDQYTSIQVVDMLGQVRMARSVQHGMTSLVLDMTVLKEGLYFVQVMRGDKPAYVSRIYKNRTN